MPGQGSAELRPLGLRQPQGVGWPPPGWNHHGAVVATMTSSDPGSSPWPCSGLSSHSSPCPAPRPQPPKVTEKQQKKGGRELENRNSFFWSLCLRFLFLNEADCLVLIVIRVIAVAAGALEISFVGDRAPLALCFSPEHLRNFWEKSRFLRFLLLDAPLVQKEVFLKDIFKGCPFSLSLLALQKGTNGLNKLIRRFFSNKDRRVRTFSQPDRSAGGLLFFWRTGRLLSLGAAGEKNKM